MRKEINAVSAIAFRDLLKFLRDRTRVLSTFIFPFVFIGVLGASLQSNLGENAGFNFMTFVFIGVLAQTFFESTASGIISLIEDRENDFSQEIFVSPISRYSIVIGKILGETSVSLAQGIGILFFGLLIGIKFTLSDFILLAPVVVLICLFGGAFGLIVMTNLKSRRAADQVFPFIIFPQFFLSGIFNPIKDLPWYLFILSRLTPMTYAVDLGRSVFYLGKEDYGQVVLHPWYVNAAIIVLFFIVFISIGTYLFVRNERNK